MPTFECAACGYSCGSAKAWAKHLERTAGDGGKHELLDPSLLQATHSSLDEAKETRLALPDKRRERDFSLDAGKIDRSLEHASTPIIAAARRGNVSALTALLAAAPSLAELSRCDAAGMSAMAWAAKTGNLEVVRALLGARASPNLAHTSTACVSGHGAEPDGAASEAHPPLYLALTSRRFDAARVLLDAGARVLEAEPVRGQTALHAACSTDAPLDVIDLLLRSWRHAHDALSANDRLDDLDEAVNEDHHPTNDRLDALDEVGAAAPPPPLPADADGCTPLHSACASGHVACARLLLEFVSSRGSACELRRASLKDVTPLAAACRRRHAEVAILLREHGAPLDPMAVHLSLAKAGGELLGQLVDTAASTTQQHATQASTSGDLGGDGGADADGIDSRLASTGVSALMLATEAGGVDAVRTLLGMGADAGAADTDGHTALMRAAFLGHAEIVRMLIAAGCAVDAVDAEGNSALHHAGRGSQEFIFDLLEMRHGADCERRNVKGEVPTLAAEPCRMQ